VAAGPYQGGVLLLFHRPKTPFARDATTVMEHVGAFERHSQHRVWAVNTDIAVPDGLERHRFGAIVLHYSLFQPRSYHLDERLLRLILNRGEDCFLAAFFQDEFHYCQDRFRFLDEVGAGGIFSCLESPHMESVYSRVQTARHLRSVLPGYVGESIFRAGRRFRRSLDDRDVDVSYRGRSLPTYAGRGGREKYEIGIRFQELASGAGLRLDIACDEADRVYGDDWYRFIARSIAVLGTESGVDYIDLEDAVLREYEELSRAGFEPSIDALEAGELGRWEHNHPYRTISPRHFEAAALDAVQILFEGEYSGAMEAGVHYIPLKKDFSNFDEVTTRFHDKDLRRELVRNARVDLVESGKYSYQVMIRIFDDVLAEVGVSPEISPEAVQQEVDLLDRLG
jgi:hypothetical protein